MASRKKQREIQQQKSQETGAFLEELQKETDRAAAVLGAAMLDEILRQLLTAFLVDDEKEVATLLEGEQASLQTFASRIRAAYCLGLISTEQRDALRLIKDIRNRFAHHLHGLSFADTEIAALCKKLSELRIVSTSSADSTRTMFVHAMVFLWLSLGGDVSDMSEDQRQVKSNAKTPGEVW